MQRAVDLQHEGMEMDAPLPLHRRAGEEEIHQHGFAGAHAAEDIEPLRRRLGAAVQPEALAPAAAAGRPGERIVQRLQLLGGELLGRVGLEQPFGAFAPVGGERPGGGCAGARPVPHRPPAARRIAPVT